MALQRRRVFKQILLRAGETDIDPVGMGELAGFADLEYRRAACSSLKARFLSHKCTDFSVQIKIRGLERSSTRITSVTLRIPERAPFFGAFANTGRCNSLDTIRRSGLSVPCDDLFASFLSGAPKKLLQWRPVFVIFYLFNK